MYKHINFSDFTSYNYDALLNDTGRYVTIKCKNLPQRLKKFNEGYLVGSKAFSLFCNQFSVKFACLKNRQCGDYDVIFRNSGNINDCQKKIEQLNLGFHFNFCSQVVKVFADGCDDDDLDIDLVFLYRNPEDSFLYFDFNFLCLFVDIDRELFILSTQFLEFIQTKVVKYKPSPIIGYFGSTQARARLSKYLNPDVCYKTIFVEPDALLKNRVAKQKFKNLVYKVIILYRLYRRVVVVRNFNRVIFELESYFYMPRVKPVFNLIAGSKFLEVGQHYQHIQF